MVLSGLHPSGKRRAMGDYYPVAFFMRASGDKGVARGGGAVVTCADGARKGSRVQGPGYRVKSSGTHLVERTNSWPMNPGAHES